LICFASSDAEGEVTSTVSPPPWRGWAVPAAVGGAGSVKALDLDVSPGEVVTDRVLEELAIRRSRSCGPREHPHRDAQARALSQGPIRPLGPPAFGPIRCRSRCRGAPKTAPRRTVKKEISAPLHFQFIPHRGACYKPRPCRIIARRRPEPTEMEVRV
jgi:hypothetical protein